MTGHLHQLSWPGRMARWALFLCATFFATSALSQTRIRIAVQKTGTLAWELGVIRDHGLDRKAGLDIAVIELASPEAGKIALKSGSADIIVSDWLWVSRERALGGRLVFYPYASAVGAVMVRADSGIRDVAGLAGKRLAIAGGPLDKSWLLLQGLAKRSGLDLKSRTTLVFGAPPLLSQKALQGEHDATLTFWNFAAMLESKGLVPAIDMAVVQRELGASGPVAMLGYAFDGEWALTHRVGVERFLGVARQAKDILAASDEEWAKLAPRIGVNDPATLAIFRRRYADGIPRRPIEDEERDALALYQVLAATGGSALVGPGRVLDKGTFWRPAPRS